MSGPKTKIADEFVKAFESGAIRPDAMTHCSHGKSYRNEDCQECDSVWSNAMTTTKERELSATVKEQAAKIAKLEIDNADLRKNIVESNIWLAESNAKNAKLEERSRANTG